MDGGQFAFAFETTVRRFNGKLFRDATAFSLDAKSIGHLRSAASKRWTDVVPSIFGALLERALSAKDRAKLGAHFTPRAHSEYQYPTLVRMEIQVSPDPEGAVLAKLVDQRPDDRP